MGEIEMGISLAALDGDARPLSKDEIDVLRGRIDGQVASEGEAGYDQARTIWNGMVDRRPGLVIRAAGVADIRAAVDFARNRGLLIAIRSGGHQIAGHAVAQGALLLDLSQMKSVEVDVAGRTARVQAGALLADVDAATQAHGLAVPVGINSTTGIAGLTLGGGFGWLTRKYGLTIDNLLSAEVVTADGALRTASASENPDLFWALRGGGGNFGVVASFQFALHPVGPEVLSGLIVHPLDDARDLLRALRGIVDKAEDELTVWTVMRKAPPLPFIPEDWHGREVMILATCYSGDMAEGEKAMAGLRGLGSPIADVIGPHPFAGWQQAFDPLLTPGARNYWKTRDFVGLDETAAAIAVEAVRNLPDDECEVFFAHLGGAMARVSAEATPFPTRDAHFVMNVHTRWRDPAKDAECKAWARALFDATEPYSAGSAYVNFVPDDEPGRVAEVYGANMARLAGIKGRYDPDNLFRLNHNIVPIGADVAAQ